MGRGRRWTAGLMVGAFVMTGAACTDEPTRPSDLSDTTSSAVSSSASDSNNEHAVIEAYKGFFTALTNLKTLDESSVRSALAPYGAGPAVENLVEVARILTSDGQVPAGTVQFADLSVEIASSKAVVNECRDTSTESIVDAATGETVSTGQPGTKFVANLSFETGAWKVTDYSAVEAGC